MSGDFDSRKDSQSTKFEQRPQMFVKLSFRFPAVYNQTKCMSLKITIESSNQMFSK